MFRKTLLMSTLLLAPLGVYADPPNSVGWGLGSQIFDGQSGVAPQVLAVTTNGTLGNQTFGISSGTSGCKPGLACRRLSSAANASNSDR